MLKASNKTKPSQQIKAIPIYKGFALVIKFLMLEKFNSSEFSNMVIVVIAAKAKTGIYSINVSHATLLHNRGCAIVNY